MVYLEIDLKLVTQMSALKDKKKTKKKHKDNALREETKHLIPGHQTFITFMISLGWKIRTDFQRNSSTRREHFYFAPQFFFQTHTHTAGERKTNKLGEPSLGRQRNPLEGCARASTCTKFHVVINVSMDTLSTRRIV